MTDLQGTAFLVFSCAIRAACLMACRLCLTLSYIFGSAFSCLSATEGKVEFERTRLRSSSGESGLGKFISSTGDDGFVLQLA